MAVSDKCITRVTKASKGTVSRAKAKELLENIEEKIQRDVENNIDSGQSLDNQIEGLLGDLQQNSEKARKLLLMQLNRKQKTRARIKETIENEGQTVFEGFKAVLVGSIKNLKSGRFSIDSQQLGLQGQIFGSLSRELESENLLPLFTSRRFEKEVGQEMWNLSIDANNPTLVDTGNAQAKSMARIVRKHQDILKNRQNRAGAQISDIDGFVISQTHDIKKMRKMGKEAWIEKINPLLDRSRTFDGDEKQLAKSLSETYDAMTTNLRKNFGEFDEMDVFSIQEKLFPTKNISSLAKKVSQERKLIFKDYDSWSQYNTDFGRGDLYDSMLSQLLSSVENTVLMENFGPSPEATIKVLLKEIKTEYRDKPEKLKKLLDSDRPIENFYKEVSGFTRTSSDPNFADISSKARSFLNITDLGMAVISAFSDIPLKTLELTYQGDNFLSSFAKSFDVFVGKFASKEKREVASLIDVGMTSMISDVSARLTSGDNIVGSWSKAQRLFFKLNFLQPWTDGNKKSLGIVMSHSLGLNKNKLFSELDVDKQRVMKQAGINESEWDLYRKTARNIGEKDYIVSEGIFDLKDSEIKKHILSKRLNESQKNTLTKSQRLVSADDVLRERELLSLKISTYFSDRAEFGVLTPGARERAIVTQGTQRGTIEGEALRFFWQYKSFAIAMITKVWGRALYSKGKADIPAMAGLILMSGAFGYMSMSAKDLLKGKKPRDPLDPKTILAAYAQGGGLGIWGDLLFGDYNRFGGGGLETLAGPAAGTLGDVTRLYARVRDGDDAAASSLRFAVSNTPFANLFWLRPALDEIMLRQLMEELNPGSFARYKRKLKKDTGQELWIESP